MTLGDEVEWPIGVVTRDFKSEPFVGLLEAHLPTDFCNNGGQVRNRSRRSMPDSDDRGGHGIIGGSNAGLSLNRRTTSGAVNRRCRLLCVACKSADVEDCKDL